jgi:hypothetical protein
MGRGEEGGRKRKKITPTTRETRGRPHQPNKIKTENTFPALFPAKQDFHHSAGHSHDHTKWIVKHLSPDDSLRTNKKKKIISQNRVPGLEWS